MRKENLIKKWINYFKLISISAQNILIYHIIYFLTQRNSAIAYIILIPTLLFLNPKYTHSILSMFVLAIVCLQISWNNMQKLSCSLIQDSKVQYIQKPDESAQFGKREENFCCSILEVSYFCIKCYYNRHQNFIQLFVLNKVLWSDIWKTTFSLSWYNSLWWLL